VRNHATYATIQHFVVHLLIGILDSNIIFKAFCGKLKDTVEMIEIDQINFAFL
jgi:hypothetical protein